MKITKKELLQIISNVVERESSTSRKVVAVKGLGISADDISIALDSLEKAFPNPVTKSKNYYYKLLNEIRHLEGNEASKAKTLWNKQLKLIVDLKEFFEDLKASI